MNLCRCKEGHFYDKEKHADCPHCNPDGLTLDTDAATTSIQDALSTKPVKPPSREHIRARHVEDVERFQRDAVELPTDVYAVELFRSFGQIRRKGVFEPVERCTQVVLLGLPVSVREDSIHLLAEKGLVSRRISIFRYQSKNEEEKKRLTEKSAKLLEEAEPLFNQLQLCELKIKSLRRFIKLQSKKASNHRDYEENIRSAETEWNSLTEQHRELKRQAKEVIDQDIKLKNKIAELDSKKAGLCGLKLEFVAEPGRKYRFHLDYMVDNVGWSPRYDLLTYTKEAEAQLVLQADIYQDSGEDWSDVRLKLTTENDLPASDAATLAPQNLSLKMHQPGESDAELTCPVILPELDDGATTIIPDFKEMEPAEEVAAHEENSLVQRRYTIEDTVSMKSNMTCTFVLTRKSLSIRRLFFSIPKKECSEYMGVYAEELKDEKWIGCSMRIYVDDTFSTMLQTEVLHENGIVVLGRSHGVSLQRRVQVNEESSKLLSGQKKISRAYEIVVENQMNELAQILVMDQIPVSRHSAVTVSNVNVGKAEIDEAGICRWDIMLEPHEEVILPVEYVITYPQKEELVWG